MMSPRMESLWLPPDARAASLSRRFVLDTLARWGLKILDETAVLLTSELVTNAVVHAGTEIELSLRLDGQGCVTVSVQDGSSVVPQMRSHAAEATTGRGLQIIEELAASWEVIPKASGKTVLFRLQAPGGC
jgi:anti-sigma regulatory factor (Ser/Thr protein kinase)